MGTWNLRRARVSLIAVIRASLAAAAACTLVSGSAHADHVSGLRSELLVEARHEVDVTLERGFARLRVRRTVFNGGDRHDQATFMIDLPRGAVATSLATLGTLSGRPHWFAGELMEAEAAAARYRELTGIGGYYPKDPALLSWRSQGQLALQVFPCAPKLEKSIEYTLLLPTRYEEGAHRVELPALGTSDLSASLVVRPGNPRDTLFIDGKRARAGARLKPKQDDSIELAIAPASSDTVAGELAVVPFSDTRVLTRFAVQAAPQLSRAPRGAFVVVALDASRSVSQASLDAQTSAASAYLSHLPDARVEVLLFDREVRRRYGSFVAAKRARQDLEALPIEQHNGSAVDLALAEAEKLLAKTPAGRPRRILLMTDGLARSKLRPDRLKSALGTSGAIAHVAITNSGGVELSRDDAHVWAPAPRSTGGLLWQLSATEDAGSRAALTKATLELVRPIRIDRLRVYSPDLALGEREAAPERLDEGEGHEDTFIGPREVSWIRVEGELWSKPVRRAFHPDAGAAKRWAALVFGGDLVDELNEAEMMVLAKRGGAVSPVTSYLAIEPGVRPSTEGIEWGDATGSAFGAGGVAVRMGATAVSGRIAPIDRQAFLQDALRSAWRACGGQPGTGQVSFETTLSEVVDVTSVDIGDAKDPLLSRCLSEAAWDLALTPHFSDEWNVWSVGV